MTTFSALRTGACLTALLTGQAAMADVTARQVWDAWQGSFSAYGPDATLTTGAEDDSSGTLTVSDLNFRFDDGTSVMSATVPEIVFRENGDGTVTVDMANSMSMAMTGDDGTEIDISLTISGDDTQVSGTPEAMSLAITADQYVIAVDRLVSPGGPVDGDIRFALNAVNGSYDITTGDIRDTRYDLKAESVDILVDVASPQDDGTVMLSGKIEGIATAGSMSAPADMDFSDPTAMFGGNFSAGGSYTTGPAAYIIAIDSPEAKVSGTSTSGPGTLAASIGADGVNYEGSVSDVAVELTSSEIPFPLKLSASSYGFGIAMPLGPTDAPVPFKLKLDLSDLSVNDEVWAMADPAGTFPHDPATVRIDLSGAAQLDTNLTDPAGMEAMAASTKFPGKLESLNLNELTVDAVGLRIDGTGAFTFDNSDTTTFQGMPRPEGKVTLDVVGINKLIDNLVAMGLVPEDQVMMGRMVMGMFATPTGDDALQSVIEINAQGQVMANGQRIR